MLKCESNVEIIVYSEDGSVEHIYDHNLITNVGLNRIGALASTDEKLNRIAIGIGTTPAAVTDTALANQVGVYQIVDSTSTSRTVTLIAFIPMADLVGRALSEVGLLDTSNQLFARMVLPSVINKTDQKGVQMTWSLIFDRS
jgi:hypothetical protein